RDTSVNLSRVMGISKNRARILTDLPTALLTYLCADGRAVAPVVVLALSPPSRKGEGLFPFHTRPRRSLFLREARREERDLVIPNKRRVTPPRTKTGPALRVAREMGPAVVAGLAKGITITGVLRLTGDHFARQRGLR
ncbi:MAG: hypothetical protein K2X58_01820, partial [Pseudomonadaceae bacterium]|nr:hypothetical protein [Pseudomonadaceae bacterium]